MKYELVVPCLFGIESTVSYELKNMGYEVKKVEDGRVTFIGDEAAICKANLWLRTGERVMVQVGQFKAYSFEDLFQGVKKIAWENFLTEDCEFPVARVRTIKSKLYSVPDIQSVAKKAIVEKMSSIYKIKTFQENGDPHNIHIFINKDMVSVMIDTTGEALHKRGYREMSGGAPIRETLAAFMVMLTPWKWDRSLVDPFCGSGTILIEAAMIALNMAPGINRNFAGEKLSFIPKNLWWNARKEAHEAVIEDRELKLYGYDKDIEVLEIAQDNAELAGVLDYIEFKEQDVKDLELEGDYGFVITNPPYGERLEDKKSVEEIYKVMGQRFRAHNTWSYYMITSLETTEELMKMKSTKKRKLYNGMLRTDYYQFPGKRPERKKAE